MKLLIPVKLIDKISDAIDIDAELSNLKEKNKQKLTKRLIELWYFIYQKQINDKDVKNLKFYVDIHSNEFTKFDIMVEGVRLRQSNLLKLLISVDLIKTTNSYSVGRNSNSWKIITDFLSFSSLTEFKINFNLIFKGTKNKEFWLNKYPNHKSLIEDAYNVSIDLDSYLNWMNNNVGIELNPVYNKKTGLLEKRFLTEERIYLHFNLALKVNLKNIWFKLSNEGRFYSSISNLPSNSIDFIKLYGFETARVDIKNCQPLLLSSMISNEEFKKDCESGVFYDRIRTALSGESASFLNRAEVKLMCYKFIFFGSKPLKSGRLYNAMEKVYKGATSEINSIKQDKCLAKELQKKESDIFVKKIGKIKLFKLLRHDEVIVTVNDEDKIKKYLINEFKRHGFIINFNII
jgi:hypothetical protein